MRTVLLASLISATLVLARSKLHPRQISGVTAPLAGANGNALGLCSLQYKLQSNLFSGSLGGNQTVQGTGCHDGLLSYKTSWQNFPGPAPMSYANAQATAVGLSVGSITSMPLTWAFTFDAASSEASAVIALWLNTNATGQQADPTSKFNLVIVPTASQGYTPAGSRNGSVTALGSTWTVYTNSDPSVTYEVITLVAHSSVTDVTGDLVAVLSEAVTTLGVSKDLYIVTAAAGVQVQTGTGSFETKSFGVQLLTTTTCDSVDASLKAQSKLCTNSTPSTSISGNNGGQSSDAPHLSGARSAVLLALIALFWHELTRLKIEVLKLDDKPIDVWGTYTMGRRLLDKETSKAIPLRPSTELGSQSFSAGPPTQRQVQLRGTLKNFNTIEEFKSADKPALFAAYASQLWAACTTRPTSANSLNTFHVLTFSDLKKYKYYYWFCFPSFIAQPAWQCDSAYTTLDAEADHAHAQVMADWAAQSQEDSAACLLKSVQGRLVAGKLSEFGTFFDASDAPTVAFVDPSAHESALGWPARNVLTYLSEAFEARKVTVIALRAPASDGTPQSRTITVSRDAQASGQQPAAVGWEKNAAGKLGPRLADLGPMMDPTRLADQAIDLNLQLMRWRILPELDLEKIKTTKCLLLGAGTLGCYVSRSLLAWGVRTITLVDSSTVSFSNPVRQPLFEFKDCLEGGKPKAGAAADALKRIYPAVNATGIHMSIPMPGHPVPPKAVEDTRATVQKLERLIDEHDVIYLLMDSRESRWLPTMLGAAKGRLVMNAALGFDSFLVMRHGLPPADATKKPQSTGVNLDRLGCYYCMDLVAPIDSLTDRTLDQMCTVTRPGLAAIASATAVELMCSVLQHPQGAHALSDVPLPGQEAQQDTQSVLGLVPHQLRGMLGRFETLKITGQAYDKCTGCSQTIVNEYLKRGFEMVLDVCADGKALERMTGLDKLHAETEAAMESLDWDSDGASDM
ncbi:glycoside hydrolase family 12 protein [Mixia osmundae IAM 14324]|uniref:Ubiquitin-like modifier-activating enzyme ATG7 n=1 Tax=Mixia osmundae (strain CBS 9802 / IAM 14324 / JCM 22182 / KY 12970) TaxID=764103 RepID=G7DUP4_MIXOS|nr:glycoside hydrolase family 12 protein [Mixia osmundae IAM 14324]KEI37481.1 glycoside hydrolase family 12 protein [Mixia osmundae IAM 14324]GAA94304.1 hypothetical protein E5Q_00953 [Mixia osmundae IAM 14324]